MTSVSHSTISQFGWINQTRSNSTNQPRNQPTNHQPTNQADNQPTQGVVRSPFACTCAPSERLSPLCPPTLTHPLTHSLTHSLTPSLLHHFTTLVSSHSLTVTHSHSQSLTVTHSAFCVCLSVCAVTVELSSCRPTTPANSVALSLHPPSAPSLTPSLDHSTSHQRRSFQEVPTNELQAHMHKQCTATRSTEGTRNMERGTWPHHTCALRRRRRASWTPWK